jgi:hypothetical protein
MLFVSFGGKLSDGIASLAIQSIDGALTFSKPQQPEFPPIRLNAQALRRSVRDWMKVKGLPATPAQVNAVAIAVEALLGRV